MCQIYNTIGSLKTLKSHLYRNNIYDFKSLKHVIDFQRSYTVYREQIISNHENLIVQEKNLLNTELKQLEVLIQNQKLQLEKELTDEINELKQQLKISSSYTSKNILMRLIKYLGQWNYARKIKQKEGNFELEVQSTIKKSVDLYQQKNNRYQFIISRFSDAVKQSAQGALSELERKKLIIDECSSFIYGALGEQKVVKTLEVLSDEYFLINDFSVSLSNPLYNRQENDYIKSIQIDHILVAPSGIFLIETKNWSGKSIENLSFRSPVQQIKRTSFVLFKLLNNEMGKYFLNLDKHHWGDKKISIRNLIVLINSKPKEEFQYVKILTLEELIGYVNYFKPIFTKFETQRIAEYLISTNNLKNILISKN